MNDGLPIQYDPGHTLFEMICHNSNWASKKHKLKKNFILEGTTSLNIQEEQELSWFDILGNGNFSQVHEVQQCNLSKLLHTTLEFSETHTSTRLGTGENRDVTSLEEGFGFPKACRLALEDDKSLLVFV